MGQVPGDAVQEVPKLLSGALREARAWFRNVLKEKLLKEYLNHVAFSLFSELRVCHLLIMYKGALLWLSQTLLSAGCLLGSAAVAG